MAEESLRGAIGGAYKIYWFSIIGSAFCTCLQMKLFIHTSSRWQRQLTLEWLEPLRKSVILVVQQREERKYSSRYENVRLLVLPPSITTLSPTRQYIMEYALKKGIEKLVLLDDDLRFFKRKPPTANTEMDHSLLNATPKEVVEMFMLLEDWLDDVAHASLSSREGNNHVEEEYIEVGRMMRCLAYNVPRVMKTGAKFDRVPAKQDFDFTLQLLRAGLPNRISYLFAQGQGGGSGAKGGCARYRTHEMLEECAKQLERLHPKFVKIVDKSSRTSFGGGTRTDVVVSWDKAYRSAFGIHQKGFLTG